MADLQADDIAAQIIARYERASNDRGVWESHWEEIAQRVLPSYSGSFTGRELQTQGSKRTQEMFDATAAMALTRFAAAMESMLTPRGSRWHRLIPTDKTLMRNRAVRMWFDDVTDILFQYRYAPRANYASNQHEVYMGLGAFGTGAMYIDKLMMPGEKGLRYRAIHLGEIVFLENHQGIIDTAMRKYELTARQAYQQFGDSLPSDILEKAKESRSSEQKFWFINCVQPRTDEMGYDPGRRDVKGMRYAAHTVSITGKKEVREAGFHVFPYPISRYVVAPGETYGRSPAMLVLPAIKVLNEEKKTVLKQGHRAIDPVLLAHDDGVLDGFSLKPGSVNAGGVSADGRPLVHALPVGNLSLAKEMMEAERAAINDAFLVTLFQILVETPQMTATEVLERAREKGALLSPTMGRQQSEFLGPTVERELDVLAQQNLLPPMPLMLQQARGEYQTIYDSPLSRSQRAEEAAGLMRLVGWAQEVVAVTQDPSIMDNFDFDSAMPELADIQAVPSRWMRDDADKAAIRDARAKQAQAKQLTEAAPSLAAVAKALPSSRINVSQPAA